MSRLSSSALLVIVKRTTKLPSKPLLRDEELRLCGERPRPSNPETNQLSVPISSQVPSLLEVKRQPVSLFANLRYSAIATAGLTSPAYWLASCSPV